MGFVSIWFAELAGDAGDAELTELAGRKHSQVGSTRRSEALAGRTARATIRHLMVSIHPQRKATSIVAEFNLEGSTQQGPLFLLYGCSSTPKWNASFIGRLRGSGWNRASTQQGL